MVQFRRSSRRTRAPSSIVRLGLFVTQSRNVAGTALIGVREAHFIELGDETQHAGRERLGTRRRPIVGHSEPTARTINLTGASAMPPIASEICA